MGADSTSNDVVRVAHGGHPVAHGFVYRIAKSSTARSHWADFRSHRLHFKNIKFLPADIFLAHVNPAGEIEKSASCGGRDAMLAGPGFSDYSFLAHSFRKKSLPDGIIYLVGTGMI